MSCLFSASFWDGLRVWLELELKTQRCEVRDTLEMKALRRWLVAGRSFCTLVPPRSKLSSKTSGPVDLELQVEGVPPYGCFRK